MTARGMLTPRLWSEQSMLKMMSMLIVTACACVASPTPVFAEPPEVFDKRPYVDAKKAAEDGRKWFIVKATAEWCPPCKQMDKTTWIDEKVVSWFKKNGVAVALDVDKDPKLAGDLKIEAMPTMIAFKDGKEFDRVVGYKSPADMMTWLEGVARGEKSIETTRKRAAAKDGDREDIDARLDLAKQLAQDGKSEQAAAEYAWLWKNMLEHQPSMYGIRLSFMAAEMQDLAAGSIAARKTFVELRDKQAKELENEKVSRDDVVDWVTLNRVLNDGAATLKWYDRVKDEARWKPLVSRVSKDLAKLFVESRRWTDLGKLYPDPIAELEREHSFVRNAPKAPVPPGLDEAMRRQLEDIPSKLFREKNSRLYAGLLAAGRDADAQEFIELAYELEKNDGRVIQSFVEASLDAGQARAAQIKLIDAVIDPRVSLDALKTRVEEALEKRGSK